MRERFVSLLSRPLGAVLRWATRLAYRSMGVQVEQAKQMSMAERWLALKRVLFERRALAFTASGGALRMTVADTCRSGTAEPDRSKMHPLRKWYGGRLLREATPDDAA